MEAFSLFDGLSVTVVAMTIVFLVLAGLWLLIEITHKLIGKTVLNESATTSDKTACAIGVDNREDSARERAAIAMALVLAHEENGADRFKVEEVQKIIRN
ncbi:OadG family protein [Enterococcus sp. 669A]|uniref:OadG family protein n=1 Tax=Candidatus Enterococcus moelleringii TaxID=2815325 RepID=A0ABS3L7X0_9ENTE|nr:OadG family protein [Enterococcus sp. 669A]MBO1305721.1 OadG family protein [Enterococcus sp. 669A]